MVLSRFGPPVTSKPALNGSQDMLRDSSGLLVRRDPAGLGFHPVQFGLEEVNGRYWLVQRVSGATDPERLAGPLLSPADSGLVFSYYDVDGVATTTPSDVATVEILLKAESREDLSAYVRSGNLADTLRLRVSVRNN